MIVKFGAGAQCADFFILQTCNASSQGAIFGRLAPRVEQTPPKWLPTTGKLDIPKNITPIFLPSRSPELNPVENIWQYLRANWLSNRVFETYDAIIDAACNAWRKLIAQPQTIISIGMRDWAHIGQSQ